MHLPLGLIFLVTQFVGEMTEREAEEDIWSSVHDLFFISTSFICGKSWQDRQSIVWSKDLTGVLGLEMRRAGGDWLKGSYNIALPKCKKRGFLLRMVSCKELHTELEKDSICHRWLWRWKQGNKSQGTWRFLEGRSSSQLSQQENRSYN